MTAAYRQNTILYLKEATAFALGPTATDPALHCVHPASWDRANGELAHAKALPESEVLRQQAEAAQQQ